LCQKLSINTESGARLNGSGQELGKIKNRNKKVIRNVIIKNILKYQKYFTLFLLIKPAQAYVFIPQLGPIRRRMTETLTNVRAQSVFISEKIANLVSVIRHKFFNLITDC